jgi:hypothetical protein
MNLNGYIITEADLFHQPVEYLLGRIRIDAEELRLEVESRLDNGASFKEVKALFHEMKLLDELALTLRDYSEI